MAETPISYGLTTKNRVKDRLNISSTNLDTLIDRLIAAVTDFIEGETGGRRFLRTTYTNEVYSVMNDGQQYLALKQIPIVSVSALEYRTGLKSNPNWTAFNTDDWEILEDGATGLIKLAGMPSPEVNVLRVSYVAGYLIDFDSAGSPTSHTLPYDLTDLAEELIDKKLKRRNNEGVQSESYAEGSITYAALLSDANKAVLARYTRLPAFF